MYERERERAEEKNRKQINHIQKIPVKMLVPI